MRRPTAVLLTLLASAALAAPAGAADAPTSYFFACTDGAKYQGNRAESWSTERPTGSYRSGAGCGSLDTAFFSRFGGQKLDFYGGGVHTGRIQAINVELHSLLLSQARVLGDDIRGRFELRIDGIPVALDETQAVVPELSADGLTEKFVFSFSARKPTGATVAPPLVQGGEHKVSIRFTPYFFDYQNIWVWGAEDVAAGVVVNPPKLSIPRVLGDPFDE